MTDEQRKVLKILKDLLKSDSKLEEYVDRTIVYRIKNNKSDDQFTPATKLVIQAFSWPINGGWREFHYKYNISLLKNKLPDIKISWGVAINYLKSSKGSQIAFAKKQSEIYNG